MRSLLLAVAALLLAGCVSGPSPGPDTSAGMVPGAFSAFAPGPYEFTTTIQDGRFQHTRLDAFVDGTIRWWNVGDETHAVYSNDGAFPSSGPLAPGSEFTFTFLRAGDYGYHCPYHPEMTGVVIVR